MLNTFKINICNNCGKQGHTFNQCKLPITSYGIILFRHALSGLQFLMIRRKDSFGYIDFIRGKYLINNLSQIKNKINEMSIHEKRRILELPFETLWKDMWGETIHNQYKYEFAMSKKKFDMLKEGVFFNEQLLILKDIVEFSETSWTDTEWEFPKGRRDYKERDLDCALREFEEETGISTCNLKVIENVLPFEEIYIGSNHKSYKHKYFLAIIEDEHVNLNNFQVSEVSKMEWKTYDECLESIRPYNLEKKELIININKILQEYRLYL